MARETTDLYKIKVIFPSVKDKFMHTFRNFSKELELEQTDSGMLSDNYTVQVGFKTIEQKFKDYFCKGEWVNSYTVMSTDSDALTDEFEVEVKSKGGAKKFEKSFHSQESWNGKFDVQYTLISTKTKDLGVLNPYGATSTKSEKEVLNLLRILTIEALRKAGFKKASKIQPNSVKDKFTASVIGGGDYFGDYDSKLVCVHLAGWKVGLTPITQKLDRFKVQIARPRRPSHYCKKPQYQPYHSLDFTIQDRVRVEKSKKTNFGYSREKLIWRELFLGDPKIGDVLGEPF
jgi:hypothetical protein